MWSNLPEGFPNCEKTGLTTEEGHLLNAINLAWTISDHGRKTFYVRVLKRSFLVMAFIVIILFGRLVLSSSGENYTTSVNAATVSATIRMLNIPGNEVISDFVESTMSAIFK